MTYSMSPVCTSPDWTALVKASGTLDAAVSDRKCAYHVLRVLLWLVELDGAVRIRRPVRADIDPMFRSLLEIEEQPVPSNTEKCRASKTRKQCIHQKWGGEYINQKIRDYAEVCSRGRPLVSSSYKRLRRTWNSTVLDLWWGRERVGTRYIR